jgi:hypothetical protein
LQDCGVADEGDGDVYEGVVCDDDGFVFVLPVGIFLFGEVDVVVIVLDCFLFPVGFVCDRGEAVASVGR